LTSTGDHAPAAMFLKSKRNGKTNLITDLSDEQLVILYLETGNKESIAVLFERYTHLVYGICLNYLQDSEQSKDAVMEIFESLFEKLATYKITHFRNWLCSVTRNHCFMHFRKTDVVKRAKDHFKNEWNESEIPDFMEDDEVHASKGMILSAVGNLNPEQEQCIRLMYIDDKSYKDISAITGFSLNEVKSHIQNGKRNLKNFLQSRDDRSDAKAIF
jgi:RNA polymerase sigma-70 factor (ECF subfamily)